MIMDVARDAILTMLIISAPPLLAGMVIGLIIALFQTLTQIQEMTLVFVPKIVVVFASLLLTLPWMVRQASEFMERLMDIVTTLD
ncbi:Flagellar biosynthesis protein FliQ [Rhodospirillum rubrum ATCC 11170]|uniref:Flagellar biosynthetic protein FliQ n=2 Tax=Rhodospirillum rubrum TaxID=1085 RepID=Q2RQH5_RHORT|nr:Flagellar biosynthesis protein FliQ [Rhodospirillum rubrum ATCC 11170]MBK5955297.1 flagellar biosynthetic protein FliQ [Rhodospirillum rubrum]